MDRAFVPVRTHSVEEQTCNSACDIMDFSISQKFKKFKLEMGINNVLDNYYFTRRATGYPGPGIIPSPPRNFYLTTQFKF